MSNIVKFEISEIKNILPIETEAIQLYFKPKIKDLTKKDMVRPIVSAIAIGRQIKGHSASQNDDELCADIVITELKSTFTTYSIQEVCKAIELGAKGLLGTENTVHVSAENIFKWIIAYNAKIRQEAIHKMKQHNEKQEKEAEEALKAQKLEAFEDNIINAYRDFYDNDNYNLCEGIAACYYRYLKDIKRLTLSAEVRKGIYSTVEKEYDQNYKKPDTQERIVNKIKGHDPEVIRKNEIENKCQAIALKLQFDEWKTKKVKLWT